MIKVLTPTGWQSFKGIRETTNAAVRLNDSELICSTEHMIKVRGELVAASSVPHIKVSDSHTLYDLIEVDNGNLYYTNNVVSHNCSFVGSSGTLLSSACLKSLTPKQPTLSNHGYGYHIYEDVVKGNRYIIIADVSRGKGLDHSAFHVIDTTQVPYRQVATFRNNMITPTDYSEFIYRSAMNYNEANILVEVNDIGGQVADLLYFDFGYENIIHTENSGRSGKRVSGGFGKNIDRGIRTTKTVKSVGCSMLKLLVEQRKLLLVDKETISELNVFSKKGTSYEAEAGNHDDLVMGLVLFAWLSQDAFFIELNDSNIMHHLRDRTEAEIMEELAPFGFHYNAADEYNAGSVVQLEDGAWWVKSGI